MDERTATPVKAIIKMLYVPESEHSKFNQLINRLWFFYEVRTINTLSEEAAFFQKCEPKDMRAAFHLCIADLRPESALSQQAIQFLKSYLKQTRCPLISISHHDSIDIDDNKPHWLHVQLPHPFSFQDLEHTNNAIANFWFNLPSRAE